MSGPVLTAIRAVPRVNLMPPEIEMVRRVRRVQAGMGGAVALAAVATLGGFLLAGAAAGQEQDKQAAAEGRTRSVQRQVAAQQEVRQVYADVAAREAMLSGALGREVRWSSYLSDLSRSVPDGVWLKNLTVTQSDPAGGATGPVAAATFDGVAFSYGGVATWLEALGGQAGNADPYLSSSAEAKVGERVVVGFSSTATVTEAALSRRYATPGAR